MPRYARYDVDNNIRRHITLSRGATQHLFLGRYEVAAVTLLRPSNIITGGRI
ncbi:MAG: hypothetical protein ACTXOO_00760 [Sodalis sp. (in: enterobacteria)]